MVYLAELSVCVTVWFKIIVRVYARRVPRVQTKALRRRRYCLNSGINDWLVKLRSLIIDQTWFEFIDVGYFGAVNFC